MKIEQFYIDQIKQGNIVAFPTETVYGLGANAWDASAISKIFTVKGRPSDNPLIVHISNSGQLGDFTEEIPETARILTQKFWPGPLTLVFKKKPEVLDAITAGLDTVAIRMPSHPLALEFIGQTGPLVAPSANKSGRPSPTKAKHVYNDFGDLVPIIDGGSTKIGLESTVLDLTAAVPTILRPGFVSKSEIEECLGKEIKVAEASVQAPRSPGQKYSHYQPSAKVAWLAERQTGFIESNLYLLQSGAPAKNKIVYNGDLNLLAKELYDRFRQADIDGYAEIYIENLSNFKNQAVYAALQNRIEKAVGK